MTRPPLPWPLWLVLCWDGSAWSLQTDHETRAEANDAANDMRTAAAKCGHGGLAYRVVRYVPAPKKRKGGREK